LTSEVFSEAPETDHGSRETDFRGHRHPPPAPHAPPERRGESPLYSLNLLNLRTGQTTLLAEGDQISANFSPDEQWVNVCVRRQGVYYLYVLSVDGAQQREIAGPSSMAEWIGSSPDVQWALAHVIHNHRSHLFLVSVDGKVRRELVGADANVDGSIQAAFSPCGDFVLVRSDYAVAPHNDLQILTLDGTQRARLCDEEQTCASAAFTPDGDDIIFETSEGEMGRIWLADTGGENIRELALGFAPYFTRKAAATNIETSGDKVLAAKD
jgi:Tol biopolymer transport system component